MKLFKIFKNTLLIIPLALSINAFANEDNHQMNNEMQPYGEIDFLQAQSEHKTILLQFHADWCSTCKKQEPLLKSLLNEHEYSQVAGFIVDYDSEKIMRKKYKVQKQSTLIIFKGDKEVARNMGLTNLEDIKALVAKGL